MISAIAPKERLPHDSHVIGAYAVSHLRLLSITAFTSSVHLTVSRHIHVHVHIHIVKT